MVIFVDHQRYHVEKKVKCMECDKIFQNKTKLKDHISSQHKGDTYECDYCGKCLKTRQSLSKHKKIHLKMICKTLKKNYQL